MEPSAQKGRLVVISGPSGVGKSTICRRLAEDPRIEMSVSATSRARRTRELDGKDYYFLDRDEFERLIQTGGLIEWAEYVGNLYGTPREQLARTIDAGRIALLDIDVQGGRQVMEQYPDAVTIFIEPPGGDMAVVEERLKGRGTDSPQQQARRIEQARLEFQQREFYGHRIANDDLETAVEDIRKIIFSVEETC